MYNETEQGPTTGGQPVHGSDAIEALEADFPEVWEQIVDEYGEPDVERMREWWFGAHRTRAPFRTARQGAEQILGAIVGQQAQFPEAPPVTYAGFTREVGRAISQRRERRERGRGEPLVGYEAVTTGPRPPKRGRTAYLPTAAGPATQRDPEELLERIEELSLEPEDRDELADLLRESSQRLGFPPASVRTGDLTALYDAVRRGLVEEIERRTTPRAKRKRYGGVSPPAARPRRPTGAEIEGGAAPAAGATRPQPAEGVLAEAYRRIESLEREIRELREQRVPSARPSPLEREAGREVGAFGRAEERPPGVRTPPPPPPTEEYREDVPVSPRARAITPVPSPTRPPSAVTFPRTEASLAFEERQRQLRRGISPERERFAPAPPEVGFPLEAQGPTPSPIPGAIPSFGARLGELAFGIPSIPLPPRPTHPVPEVGPAPVFGPAPSKRVGVSPPPPPHRAGTVGRAPTQIRRQIAIPTAQPGAGAAGLGPQVFGARLPPSQQPPAPAAPSTGPALSHPRRREPPRMLLCSAR